MLVATYQYINYMSTGAMTVPWMTIKRQRVGGTSISGNHHPLSKRFGIIVPLVSP